jgi:hypothetical protein
MSDGSLGDFSPELSIAITAIRRGAEGLWESGERGDAAFYLVELVQGEGDAVVVVECRDERSAALAARVTAATLAVLGLAAPAGEGEGGLGDADGAGDARIEAFDEETAAILADNPTPEIAAPSGEWQTLGEEEEAGRDPER